MVRIVWASVRASGRRLISTGLAVCLGVALLCGTMVLGDTLRANFDALFTTALGRADAVVRSSTTLDTDGEFAQSLVPASVGAEIARVAGVAAVAPQIEGFGQLTAADGEKLGGNGPPTMAGNWIEDPELNPWRLVSGRSPRTTDEVVINRGAAKDGGLAVGDTTVLTSPEPVTVRIVGLATFGDQDGLGSTTFAAFTLAGAEQHITGRSGAVTSFLVRAESGVSEDALVRRIARVVPANVEVLSGAELVTEANDEIDADFLGFLRMFLVVFAAIALLVAGFSINNTFTIVAAQRQRSSALLRALGADRRQVLLGALGESLVVGAIASAIGLALGVLLATGLKSVFDAFGFALPDGGVTLRAASFLIPAVVGLGLTVAASLAPALRASRVAPLAALRDVAVDVTGRSGRRAIAGAVALVLGVVGVALGAANGSLALGGLGALASVVGTVALGPIVTRWSAPALGAPAARLRRVGGLLGQRNVIRNPRRTSATASALLVGIGVVTIFTVFAGSLKSSFGDNVEAVVQADFVIASSQFGGGGLSPGLVDAIDDRREVDHGVGLATGPVEIAGRTEQVTALDPEASAGLIVPTRRAGVPVAELAANELAVSDRVAEDRGWRLGDELRVGFGDGRAETLEVGAIFDANTLVQSLILPRATWDAHQVQSVDNFVAIGLRDGVSTEAGRRAITAAGRPFAAPDAQTKAEFVADAAARVDQFLGMIYVMLLLAIVIAVMGIANTLSLSIHERVREIGLLRAVGADRRQVRSAVRWEAVLIAILGTAGGIALGVFLGWGLVTAAGQGDFSIGFAPPIGQILAVAVAGAAVGILAAVRPARRAARLEIIGALATGE